MTREVVERDPAVTLSAFREFSQLPPRVTARVDVDGAEMLLVLDAPVVQRPGTGARRYGRPGS